MPVKLTIPDDGKEQGKVSKRRAVEKLKEKGLGIVENGFFCSYFKLTLLASNQGNSTLVVIELLKADSFGYITNRCLYSESGGPLKQATITIIDRLHCGNLTGIVQRWLKRITLRRFHRLLIQYIP